MHDSYSKQTSWSSSIGRPTKSAVERKPLQLALPLSSRKQKPSAASTCTASRTTSGTPMTRTQGMTLIKVGRSDRDVIQRFRSQTRITALPEEPVLLPRGSPSVPKRHRSTWNAHFTAYLRPPITIAAAPEPEGTEWFLTSLRFLDEIARRAPPREPPDCRRSNRRLVRELDRRRAIRDYTHEGASTGLRRVTASSVRRRE